jgi:hypothetical protein
MFPRVDVSVDDPAALSDEALGDALVELHRVEARLAAVKARVASEFDVRRVWAVDGSKSAAAWLARRCRAPIGEARAGLRLARRLRTMPATLGALSDGEIGVAQAHRLASLNVRPTDVAFQEAEESLVGLARELCWPDFCRAVAYWRQLAAPDDVEADAASDEALRRAHLSEGLRGTGILDAQLTPVGRSIVGNALEAIDRELFEADWADARARLGDTAALSDLARTPGQRRHDAVVEMARRAMSAPAGGRPPRPLVSVLVGYETVAGRICELADGTVLTPGQVAALLDEAVIERVVYDGPSRIIDIGHARRFTGALRRAMKVRDRHCTHTGCYTPANRCDIDHIHDHALGGRTEQDNGTMLCPFHHRWRHRNDPTAKERPPRATRSSRAQHEPALN